MAFDTLTTDCPRCGGKGTIDHFRHINGGECFLCDGAGIVDLRQVVAREGCRGKQFVRLQVTKDHTGAAISGMVQVLSSHDPTAFRTGKKGASCEAVWTCSIESIDTLRQIWAAWKGANALLEVWQCVTDQARRSGERGHRVIYQS